MSAEIKIQEKVNLAEFTSWQVGGDAEFYVAPTTIDELKQSMQAAHKNSWEMTILGGGTNTLVSDQGIKGLVIHTHLLNQIKVLEDDNRLVVEAYAGASKAEVLKVFMKQRLAPAIFFAGLPGDVAGGVVMNAGVGHKVSPKEFCEVVDGFDVLELNPETGDVTEKSFKNEDITWKYRKSLNWQPGIISKVRIAWPNEPDEAVLKQVREGNKRRKDTQPLNLPSCGSVFKNPEGDHAGRLIEAAGLKGFTIGGAQVSPKHANFVVNIGGSSAQDIRDVILHVQNEVEKQFNISLTNEVVFMGYFE